MSKRIRDNFNVRVKQPIDSRFVSLDGSNIDTPYNGLLSYFNDNKFHYYKDGQYPELLGEVEKNITDINKINDNRKIINILDLGAKGDGVFDNLEIFNQALELCRINKANLYIPEGNFLISAPLTITKRNFKIMGSGISSTFLSFISTDGIIVNNYYFTIQDLSIVTKTTGKKGLTINSSYANITRIEFGGGNSTSYWNNCIYTAEMWHSRITYCNFSGGANGTDRRGYGILSDYSVNNIVSHCLFQALQSCIQVSNVLSPVTGIQSEGWNIENNIMVGNGYGVYFQKGVYFSLTNNIIDQTYNDCAVFYDVNGGNINGNWMARFPENNTAPLITLALCKNINVANNCIKNGFATQKGISVDVNSTTISINGNYTENFVTGILCNAYLSSIVGNIGKDNTTDIELGGNNNVCYGNSDTTKIKNLSSSNNSQGQDYSTFITQACGTGASVRIQVPLPVGLYNTPPSFAICGITGVKAVAHYIKSASTNLLATFDLYPVGANFNNENVTCYIMTKK